MPTGVPNGSHTLSAQARDAAGNVGTAAAVTVTVSNADTTPPAITAVAVGNVTSGGASITWSTGEAATSQVEYGTTTAYGSLTPLDAALVTGHSVPLGGLSADTTYHYRVISKDAAGNQSVSADSTFTTAGAAPITPSVARLWTPMSTAIRRGWRRRSSTPPAPVAQ